MGHPGILEGKDGTSRNFKENKEKMGHPGILRKKEKMGHPGILGISNFYPNRQYK